MADRAPAPVRWRALVALLVLAICWLAFEPRPPPPPPGLGWDKAQHALAFAVLGACALRGWPAARLAVLVAALLGFGVFIELVQTQLPTRSAEIADVVADLCGAAFIVPLRRLRR
jgi:VanZ family protein